MNADSRDGKGNMERGKWNERITLFHFPVSNFLFLALLSTGLWFPTGVHAQEQESEIVVNLAAGRVVFSVARDGIVVGAVENRGEADARPPVVIPVSFHRVMVLLGATDWLWPNDARAPVLLEREFQKVYSQTGTERLTPQDEASDIEKLGLLWLEVLRPLAGQLHRKVELPEDEPLLEVLLAGYIENYGPEVWSLEYYIVQEPLRGDYLRTRVLRPRYTQLYPPEKGRPRALLESQYPRAGAETALQELLRAGDPRMEKIRAADPPQARAAGSLLKGESQKAMMNDTSSFLRAALGAVAAEGAEVQLGLISEQKGYQWVLEPSTRVQRVEEGKPSEPGAPTLRRKTPRPPAWQ